mmetsp:Transcript_30058/g.60380  ORF Transcript_30058/g.60380 Transcript_30058/m.60380 type:complete len:111 (-) Transcript_30058:878-1210(-)
MSTTEARADGVCASCGIAGGDGDDDTKLKRCGACGLVRYCGLKCQRDHRPSIKVHARKGWLNCAMSCYLSSPKAHILAIVPSVCYRSHTLHHNIQLGILYYAVMLQYSGL